MAVTYELVCRSALPLYGYTVLSQWGFDQYYQINSLLLLEAILIQECVVGFISECRSNRHVFSFRS